MPPHLHPRSRLTSSLFATTLFASFFVVALPHALPCPAPRVAYADGEMPADGSTPPRRRRRRRCEGVSSTEPLQDKSAVQEGGDESTVVVTSEGPRRRPGRECPVPKPGGLVAEILGFRTASSDGKGSEKPP
ncbi:hypothetical protein BJ875DRAFT_7541 [Amylocarpus encephaloides]|uniref:Uncharacterized protein n=1 Tax=Amylocarpus encephaloides TaxID=45428 RepID=A0A9P7YJ24_9HELO|nr:hypothetical protein BJ875DRAFT_7541 [Amylocarpus encephaloides]